MYSSVLGSIFGAVAEHQRNKYKPYEFEYLRSTPLLHGSEYLTELMGKARYKHDYEAILEHLYRHHSNGVDVLEIDSYAAIEQQIINKYRRD